MFLGWLKLSLGNALRVVPRLAGNCIHLQSYSSLSAQALVGPWQVASAVDESVSRLAILSHWLWLHLSGTMTSSLLHPQFSPSSRSHASRLQYPALGPKPCTVKVRYTASSVGTPAFLRLDARAWEVPEGPIDSIAAGVANAGKQFVADALKDLALPAVGASLGRDA
ncbi:hypothetical protein MSAN_01318500 [Mycena sanguinolenta]|uniref:Uncharacterized protein n=1 Tax=Mycena sanguinolenta TaxID=230812 RepID=A0A8H7D0P5_9AGAR|nr:hypothetical protein MSAN_01318500 [Mycena sanguinolenta]